MSFKATESGVDLDRVIRELSDMQGKRVIVGPAADESSALALYAGANEFGAEVRPKKGGNYL